MLPLILSAYDWTIMIYMAADNDLSVWADSDLVEMEEIGSDENMTIIVQLDKPNIGAKRLQVNKGSSINLAELGVVDMCDWHTLYDFFEWSIREFPAKRYLAILWDHGTGWTMGPQKTFGADYSSGNQMSIANGDFRKAIESACKATGKKLNMLAFDACLMQQAEIAYETRDYVSVMLAAQTNWPVSGFPYHKILQFLSANTNDDEYALAENLVQICAEQCEDIQPGAISAVKISRLNELKERTAELFAKVMPSIPGSDITNLRNLVQTIPIIGSVPHIGDDYIDFGDFIRRLHQLLPISETENLLSAYNNSIIASRHWGEGFSQTTGLDIWFPDVYAQFKQLIIYYTSLDWIQSQWPSFLNWFYDQDDIRPTRSTVNVKDVTGNNFRLCWQASFDLAKVYYNIIEVQDTSVIFQDDCEDSSQWDLAGFRLVDNTAHSGSYSFFSGNGSNLNNTMTTKNSITIDGLGALDIQMCYQTEDMTDSLIIEYGPFHEAYYGNSGGWVNHCLLLPEGDYRMHFSYHTNSSISYIGCYIDDIGVKTLSKGVCIREKIADTTLDIFNKLRGEYLYAVIPEDRYGNRGDISNFIAVSVINYASPYSVPNPFQDDCEVILDYPDTLRPAVKIFSITGRLVREFSPDAIQNKKVFWDCRDKNNQEVGSGLYFVLVKDGAFKTIGKIARQR